MFSLKIFTDIKVKLVNKDLFESVKVVLKLFHLQSHYIKNVDDNADIAVFLLLYPSVQY